MSAYETPKISICMPTWNSRRFIDERLSSILNQTFSEWELVVCDSGSSDGTIDRIQELAGEDSRVQIYDVPKRGVYQGINDCITRSRGKYLYIATSDDSMSSNFLADMSDALDKNSECAIAHARLKLIDEQSRELEGREEHRIVYAGSAHLRDVSHIRFAPYDGLMHLIGSSVYISLTQLLFRRSLFDTFGLFSSDWGSYGDFHWNMTVALRCNAVHVPSVWASWRNHTEQVTAQNKGTIHDYSRAMRAMVDDCLSDYLPTLTSRKAVRDINHLVSYIRRKQEFDIEFAKKRNLLSKLLFAVRKSFNPQCLPIRRLASKVIGNSRDVSELECIRKVFVKHWREPFSCTEFDEK